jgi:hypothetical protein
MDVTVVQDVKRLREEYSGKDLLQSVIRKNSIGSLQCVEHGVAGE